jgi:hypothetical protein
MVRAGASLGGPELRAGLGLCVARVRQAFRKPREAMYEPRKTLGGGFRQGGGNGLSILGQFGENGTDLALGTSKTAGKIELPFVDNRVVELRSAVFSQNCPISGKNQ